MGRHIPRGQEAAVLKELIAEARSIHGELLAVLRTVKALEPGLIKEFEDIADREVKDLSNQLQRQNNEAARKLNADVAAARAEILRQLTLMELEPIPGTDKLAFTFGAGRFDENAPLPFPNRTDVRS